MTTPSCPNCGSRMEVKLAHKGKNAGNYFYSCPNWKTTCRHQVLPIKDVLPKEEPKKATTELENFFDIPYIFKATPLLPSMDVEFFDTIAVPKSLLNEINHGNIARNEVLRYTKWRLDMPGTEERPKSNNKPLLAQALRILTRGRITLLSPWLEDTISRLIKDNMGPANLDDLFTFTIEQKNTLFKFDQKSREEFFFTELLAKLIGPHYKKYVTPQVNLVSLLTDEGLEEINGMETTVDFLISTKNRSIVVELDGASPITPDKDQKRTVLLQDNGFEVYRIPNEEIDKGYGKNLEALTQTLRNEDFARSTNPRNSLIQYVALCHQFQITIVKALLTGALDNDGKSSIYYDLKSVNLDKEKAYASLEAALNDLKNLLSKLADLYGFKHDYQNLKLDKKLINYGAGINITYDDSEKEAANTFYIRFFSYPFSIINSPERVEGILKPVPKKPLLNYFLKYLFRFDEFWDSQYEIITRVLSAKDSIVLLPTGAGKSLTFQLATLLFNGMTIIVEPLVSLIYDQLDNLRRIGIDRVAGITSLIEDKTKLRKIQDSLSQGEYLMCYVTPERFQIEDFRNNITTLIPYIPVTLIVIDEAHCVSEWGHDFRTSYLNIARNARNLCKINDYVPPLVAMTGTASYSVLRDIQREVEIYSYDAIFTPKTFDRKELAFSVFSCTSGDKYGILLNLIKKIIPSKFNISEHKLVQQAGNDTYSGLVFFPHVNGDFGVVENAQRLSADIGTTIGVYAGKTPRIYKEEDWTNIKIKNAKEFKNNKTPILFSTKAFGMGIDKPNIRYTIHFGIPNSIEAFYQEAGRAGRDKRSAVNILIYSNDFPERTNRLLEPKNSIESIREVMDKEVSRESGDDISRVLFFHLKAFQGIDIELKHLSETIDKLGDLTMAGIKNIAFKREDYFSDDEALDNDKNLEEKSVYRLLILGVIEDYTVDYANREFKLKKAGITKQAMLDKYLNYVARFNTAAVKTEREAIEKFIEQNVTAYTKLLARRLIDFIYNNIEKSKRQALREMLLIAEEAKKHPESKQNEVVRQRILRYLETTYSAEIERFIQNSSLLIDIPALFDGESDELGQQTRGVRSFRDAEEIRGQVARFLESYPENPALHFIRCVSEMLCKEGNRPISIQYMSSFLDLVKRFDLPLEDRNKVIVWFIRKLSSTISELCAAEYLCAIFDEINDRSILLYLQENLKENAFLTKIILMYKIRTVSITARNILKEFNGRS